MCVPQHLLMDYDVSSNWGNWVAAAGLTGGRVNHFNIPKQSKVRATCVEHMDQLMLMMNIG